MDSTAGDPDADPMRPDTVESSLTRTQFFEERRRLLCAHHVKCSGQDRRQRICHSAVPDEWEYRRAHSAVEGRLTFDADAGRACLDELSEAVVFCSSQLHGLFDVGDRTGIPEACEVVFVGLVAEGGECAEGSIECADGLPCRAERAGLPSRCRPYLRSGVGGPCVLRGDCGLTDDSWREYYCDEDGACRARGETGEACAPLTCAMDLWCQDGRCAQYPGLGEACFTPRGCTDGNVCIDGACAPGAAEGEDCSVVPCMADLDCREDEYSATCRSRDGFDPGDACWVWEGRVGSSCRGDDLHCSANFWFSSSAGSLGTGECVLGARAGEDCSMRRPCARGHVCSDGYCQVASAIGEPCSSDDVCPLRHHCRGGICEPLPGPGDACDATTGCIKGRCEGGVCCLAASGMACTEDERGSEWDDCDGTCWGDGCGSSRFACGDGCSTCWPRADRCVPTCGG